MTGFSPHDLFTSLRAAYVDSLPDKIEEIELLVMALERGNDKEQFEQLFRNIHSLKGSGGTYGINILTTACHQMEDELGKFPSAIDCNTLLAYVDILKEIAVIAAGNEKEFSQIESRLATAKKRQHHDRIHGLIVDASNTETLILKQRLTRHPVSLTLETDGLRALHRLLHEKFDFLIASKELSSLSGIALIGALRLNQGVNCDIRAALITSDRSITIDRERGPGHIIHKDSKFNENLDGFITEVMGLHASPAAS